MHAGFQQAGKTKAKGLMGMECGIIITCTANFTNCRYSLLMGGETLWSKSITVLCKKF